MDELTYTSDKLNFYINEIIEKSTHHKTLERIEEKSNGFVIKTIEALKPNKDIGITHKEFINTYLRYKELTGKKLDSIIIEQYKDPSAYVVTSIEEKEYFYTIECLNEIENSIKINNPININVKKVDKRFYKLDGWLINLEIRDYYFKIYKAIKNNENSNRDLYKDDSGNWWIVNNRIILETNEGIMFTDRNHAIQILNTITTLTVNKGKLMTGVRKSADGDWYVASISMFGDDKEFIGYFKTEIEAHEAWRNKKIEYVKRISQVALNEKLITLDEFNHYTSITFSVEEQVQQKQ